MKTLLFVLYLCSVAVEATAEDIVQVFSRAVISLEILHPVFEDVATNHFQVFYRLPGQTNLVPKVYQTFGTAFFVHHNAATYVVTAAHVATGPVDRGILHLIDTNGFHKNLDLEEIRNHIPGAKWFFHPTADIALHPYAHSATADFGNKDIPDTFLSTNQLPLLTPVVAIGFPLNLGTMGPKLTPIATACETSCWTTTLPGERPELEFLLLDKALAQGYSGAPILTRQQVLDVPGFHAGGGPVLVIGICHSELFDAFGGKHAAIVPVSYLTELFQQPEFLQYERDHRR